MLPLKPLWKIAENEHNAFSSLWNILDLADEGYLAINEAGSIKVANKKAHYLLGSPNQEIVGKFGQELDLWEENTSQSFLAHIDRVGKPYSFERKLMLKAKLLYLQIQIIPSKFIDKSTTGFLLIIKDISDQKKIQHHVTMESNLRKLSMHISSIFTQFHDIDKAIKQCLETLTHFIQADLGRIYQFSSDQTLATPNQEYALNGDLLADSKNAFRQLGKHEIPGMDMLLNGKIFFVSNFSDFPTKRENGFNIPWNPNTQSLLIIPINWRKDLLGFISFEAIEGRAKWTGEMMNMLAFVANILGSEWHRRKIEDAYQESSLKYQAIASMTTDIIYHFDVYDDETFSPVKFFNSQHIPYLIFEDHEGLIDLAALVQHVYGPDRKLIQEKIHHIVQGNEEQTEIRIFNQNGEIRWMLHYGKPIYDHEHQKVIGVIGSWSDITERKNLNDRLLKMQDRYELAIKSSDVGIWEFDAETQDLYVNRNIIKITGFKNNEIKHYQKFWIKIIHPDDLLELKRLFANLTKENPFLHYTFRLKHKNQSWVWLMMKAKVWTWTKEGRPKRMIGIQFNITKTQEAKEEAQALNSELVKTNNELEQFAYFTSHNLRAPVTNLKGLVDLYDSNAPDHTLNAAVMKKINQSVDALSEIVSDLHQITDLRKTEKQGEFVLFSEIIDEVKLSLSEWIKESKVTIISHLREAPGLIYYRGYMHSIIYNLLSNALKFRSPNRQLKVLIKSRSITNGVHLSISDNGLGMDLIKYNDRVFRIYQRFHTHPEGKGLGLYMIKSQVESLGGRVDVESKPDEGTCFHLFLFHVFQ